MVVVVVVVVVVVIVDACCRCCCTGVSVYEHAGVGGQSAVSLGGSKGDGILRRQDRRYVN